MMEKIEEIGLRVRELRELSRVTVEEMTEYLNVPEETYRCYEGGKMDIPASVLFKIGQMLDVDLGLLLTGKEPRMSIFTVTRKGEGVEVERRKQYKYVNLAGKFKHKKAEPFIVTVEPRKNKPAVYSHPGQEFDYVLEGSLKIYIHDNEIVLNEGDSLFFDSSYEHAMEALNDQPAKMLVVVM
ncbi:MAG: helix-turn-helix domain-containing protein [Methanosarcinales archaeon]|nr:helix-turn-helix domain-containing protein [Methanosarcinales archaeon]